MLIFWLLSCVDPDFGQVGQALEDYDRGVLALRQSELDDAIDAFTAAIKNDPERPVLHAWQAQALIRSGQVERAITQLNAALTRFPDDEVLRYQRAALLAKHGDLAESAQDLRWLYANEKAHPIAVGEDPDFLLLRTDPLYTELVPDAVVEASVTGESGSVLVGDRYTVDFSITSRKGVPIRIENRGDTLGSIRLQRLVEDVFFQDEIWAKRTLRAEFRAIQAGRIAAGPWMVQVGKSQTLTERLVIDIVSIPGRATAEAKVSIPLDVPSARWGETVSPYMGRDKDGVWAVVPSDMYFIPDSSKLGPRMEYREEGQPRWTALLVKPDIRAEVRSDGETVYRWEDAIRRP